MVQLRGNFDRIALGQNDRHVVPDLLAAGIVERQREGALLEQFLLVLFGGHGERDLLADLEIDLSDGDDIQILRVEQTGRAEQSGQKQLFFHGNTPLCLLKS